MKKIILALVIMGLGPVAFAKSLSVSCTGPKGKLNLQADIANATTPAKISSFAFNDQTYGVRNVSKMPEYQGGGNVQLQIQFGPQMYSSVELNLNSCTDSFEANGTARVKEYVGGFAGTKPSDYTCRCSLQ